MSAFWNKWKKGQTESKGEESSPPEALEGRRPRQRRTPPGMAMEVKLLSLQAVEAGLLDESLAGRLQQERTTLTRNLDKKLTYLKSLREWKMQDQVPDHKTTFHGTNVEPEDRNIGCPCNIEESKCNYRIAVS